MTGSLPRPRLSVVVPCYNEAQNIEGTIVAIETSAAAVGIAPLEIVVVDDCSSDDSAKIVTARAQIDDRVVLIRNKHNLGFGGAYKEGLKHCTGIYINMVPGDDCYPVESLTAVFRKIGEADIVVPYTTNAYTRPWARRVVSRCFTVLLNSLFQLHLPYFNGVVVHRKELLDSIEIETNSFAFQAEALIKLIKRGASYTTIGIDIEEKQARRTTAFRPKNVYRVLSSVLALWRDVNRTATSS